LPVGYTGIAVLFAVAAVVSIIFRRLRQPQILGYILAGAILARFLSSEMDVMTLISDLGITLLAFTLGMDLSLARLQSIGSRVFGGTVTEIMLMLPAGYFVGTMLHMSFQASVFFAAAFALTSTTIVSKTMIDTRSSLKPYSELVMSLLIAEDLLTVVLLAVLSAFGSRGNIALIPLLELIAEMFLFFAASMMLAASLLPKCINWVANLGSDEVLTVFSLGLCFMLAIFTNLLGFSFVIGAFVAGVAVAESGRKERIAMKLTPVRDIFLAIFFVSIGTLISFNSLAMLIPIALIVGASFILMKFLAVTFGLSSFGFGVRNAALTGVAAGAMGEFSFVIMRLGIQYGIVSQNAFTLIVLTSIVTVIVLPQTMRHSEAIASHAERAVPSWFSLYRSAIDEMREKGRERISESRRLAYNTALNAFLVISLIVLTAALSSYSHVLMAKMDEDFIFFIAGYLALALLLIFASYNTLSAEVESYLSDKSWSYDVTQRLVRHIIMSLYIIIGFAVSIVSLQPLYGYSFIPLIVGLLAVTIVIIVLRHGAAELRISMPNYTLVSKEK